jgi:hypothetical protein
MAEGYSELAKEIVSAANGIDYAYPNTGGGSEGAVPPSWRQRACYGALTGEVVTSANR